MTREELIDAAERQVRRSIELDKSRETDAAFKALRLAVIDLIAVIRSESHPNPPSGNCSTPETQGAEVVQEDREAAAHALGHKNWADATDYRNTGAEDRAVAKVAEAFARHRIAANAASEVRVAALETENAALRFELREIKPYSEDEISIIQQCFDRGILDVNACLSGKDETMRAARAALGADNA